MSWFHSPPITSQTAALSQLHVSGLAKTPGGLLNVIGEEKDLSTVLPPFSVRDVSPKGLAHALMQLLHPRGLVLIGTNLNVHGAQDVYTLRREPNAVAFNYRGAFESIQLAPFLEHQKVDDIISAVRTAWELDPAHESDALRLKYHPATTILLISGPPEAINIAQKVVTGTLKRTREPDRKSEPKAAPAAEKK